MTVVGSVVPVQQPIGAEAQVNVVTGTGRRLGMSPGLATPALTCYNTIGWMAAAKMSYTTTGNRAVSSHRNLLSSSPYSSDKQIG